MWRTVMRVRAVPVGAGARRTLAKAAEAEVAAEDAISDRLTDAPWSLGSEEGVPYYTPNTIRPARRLDPEVAMLLRGQPHEHLLADYFRSFAGLPRGELLSYVRNVLADEDVLDELVNLERRGRLLEAAPELERGAHASPLRGGGGLSALPSRYQFVTHEEDGEAVDLRRVLPRLLDRRVGPVFEAPDDPAPVWQSTALGGSLTEGLRESWRPTFDLHREQYNWLPLKDRVFRELPSEPDVVCAYVPPVDGDEELDSAEYSPEVEGRGSLLGNVSGGAERTRPLILPERRERKVDALGRAAGHGGRKTAAAQVWVQPAEGDAVFRVNGGDMSEYFGDWSSRDKCLQPLLLTNNVGNLNVFCGVRGGGKMAQAEALRMGLARALQNLDPAYRPVLKAAGMLRRDPRMVERKKPGLRKARKRKQWSKR